MWSSFTAVFKKEFLHLTRDAGTLRIAIMVPVMQLLLFGLIDTTVRFLPTTVVDQDHSTYSRKFMDDLRASRTFDIKHVTTDPLEARTDMTSARARVGIMIPPDFHDKRSRGETAKVLVLIDGSDSNVSAQALASINGLVSNQNIQILSEKGGSGEAIEAQPIIMFNPDGRTANYIIPGLVAILLQIVAVVLTAISIVREREKGTLEQLLVTPINPLGLMLGKIGPYLFFGIFEMGLVLFLMKFAFGVPIQGNLIFLFGMALVYMFALLALGLFVSTRSQTQAEAQQMSQLFLLPSIFLSGYIFPFEGLPFFLQVVGKCMPATYMVAIMRGVVLRGAGIAELWPNVAALGVISTILVFVSARGIKKVAM